MKQRLNFAPKPFLFRDPQIVGIWLLNLLALIVLIWLGVTWMGLRAKNSEAHASLRDLQQERQSMLDRHGEVVRQLEAIDLRDYRKQMTQFQGIQTAFATQWGPLLDTVGGLLPEDVRLLELKPAASSGYKALDSVVLQLVGEARTKEAELRFLEALDAHAAFDQIVFQTEDYEQPGVAVTFEIQFNYQPVGAP